MGIVFDIFRHDSGIEEVCSSDLGDDGFGAYGFEALLHGKQRTPHSLSAPDHLPQVERA